MSDSSFYAVLFGSFLTTLAAVEILRRLAPHLGFVDRPDPASLHDRPVPLLGGLAVFVGFFAPVLIVTDFPQVPWLAVACLLMLSIGLVDDWLNINAVLKLLCLIVAVAVAVQAGFRSSFFPHGQLGLLLDGILTLTWCILFISAFNATDNMDGLAGGVALVACLMFFIVGGIQFPHPEWALLSLGMVGALAAFLLYNFPPGGLFLGDSGSLFLGFFLAIMAVMGRWSAHPLKAAAIPVVILSVPLLDLCFVLLYRYMTGITHGVRDSIEFNGTDHLSHRLQKRLGIGDRRTVLIVYLLAMAVGLLGVVIRNTHPFEALVTLVIAGLVHVTVLLIVLPPFDSISWRWEDSHHPGH